MHRASILALILLSACAGARAWSESAQLDQSLSAESRAVAFLAAEVPAWRRDHPCYSCHNNGDAVRALIAARSRSPLARPAVADTLTWLSAPARWESNGGGEGGGDDKRLARIQFAYATSEATAASLVPVAALQTAAEIVAADQQTDGSWLLDSSDSIGSPATYGTALATVAARRTLARSRLEAFADRIARADRWLAGIRVENTPDAAALVLAATDSDDAARFPNLGAALETLRKGQGRDGGWGPYVTSPAEPFDTAIATLALHAIRAERAANTKRTALNAQEPSGVFTDAALREAIERGRQYLMRRQLADGSWPETTRPAGQASYAQRISTTAWALLALIEAR